MKYKNKKQKKSRKTHKISLALLPVLVLLFTSILSILLSVQYSFSVPEGPNITVIKSTTRTPQSAAEVQALAGNITQINIFGSTVTQTWQGYYGNISGTIVLQDSGNYSIYEWDNINPEGEIYVSDTSIDFSGGNIECYNFSNYDTGYYNLSMFEEYLFLEWDDPDGVNETFNMSADYDTFFAGTNMITGLCPLTNLYNGTGKSVDKFKEVLLYDITSKNVIYTALLDGSANTGFNNESMDFQMIVAENGHLGDTNPTTYYFYIEIE